MFLHLCFIEKISPCFYMRDLEHRRYIEGVVCPHVPLRGFFSAKAVPNGKAGAYFSKTKGCKIPVDFSPKCDMIQLEMTNTAETEVTYSWNFRQY